MSQSLWEQCVDRLEGELSAQQFNTWIRPLQSVQNGNQIRLLAPNQFVLDWINQNFLNRIQELITQMHGVDMPVRLEVGSQTLTTPITSTKASSGQTTKLRRNSSLNPNFTFDSFVEGKSNTAINKQRVVAFTGIFPYLNRGGPSELVGFSFHKTIKSEIWI